MLLQFTQRILFVFLFLGTALIANSQGNTCATATTITPAASCTYTSGTTVGANYQSNAANGGDPSCASPGAPDVWYMFTTTVAGNYTIDMNTGTITDSGLSLYSGTCGSLTEVDCDDDASGNGAMSLITASLAATTTYYLRVWAYGGSATGTFGICVTLPPPPATNDDCATAVALTQQAAGSCTTTNGTVAGATNSGIGSCTGTADDDVWYSFIATSTSAQVNRTTTGGWDSGVEVFQSAGAAPGVCIGASMGCLDAETAFNIGGLTVGRRYYVRVYSWSASFTPSPSTFTICITTPPPPPANDNCATATNLTQQAAGSCTTTAGTVGGATSSGIANCTGTADDDVWYSFTATNSIAIINRTTSGGWDSGVEIFASTGAAPGTCIGASLGCLDAETGFQISGLTVGMNYYVRVYSWSSGFTPTTPGFTICITTPTITTTNISACSGNFYDSGGNGGAYGNNEVRVTTICPSIAGNKISVNFSAFATENGVDYMQIFDGNSTSAPSLGVYSGTTSPGIVSATPSNASGCLTFLFVSDGITTAAGWSSVISCFVPCQTINANFVSSNPVASGGIIRVCQGQSVNLVGSGTFSNTGVGATYQWNMGNGVTVNGANINYTYPAPGSYLANLVITDPNGCTNNNALNRNIQVSTTPTISTTATPSTLCTGATSTLAATVTMTPYTVNCTPPVSGTTFLPDGTGVSYTTSITTNCYAPNETVNAATDITNVCLNMEHSFLGDLNIRIICPNGQSTTLIAYPSGGGSANLGTPWATGTVDGSSATTTPGVGANYCFTPGSATTMVSAIVAGGTFTNGNGPGTYTDSYVPAGSYMPTQSFANLIGCPLNGNWTIEVTDNLGSDNGYIFNWDVNFNSSGVSTAASFTPTIASQGWVAAPTLTNVNATTATVVPTNQGTPCFTYSVTDNFGCTYTANQCITVNCGISLPVGLVSFVASAVSNERVDLTWTTSSEINSDYFLIERSIDGNVWEPIGEVPAAGNSTVELNYYLTDNNPYNGVSYYRLKQFDLNGNLGTTDMEAVYLNFDEGSDLVLFPNPSNSLVSVKGDLVSLNTFQVFNAMGQNVKGMIKMFPQADGSLVMDISELAAGVYTVKNGMKVNSLIKE